ncbi:MAG: caspase family protein [Cyanobacteria bacterium P01_F01_bin.53]
MPRHLYALLVGINKYDRRSNISRLKGCVNDVLGMQTYLEGRVAEGEFDLHLKVLTDKQATYQNIVEGFQTHLGQAGAEDVVLFYYAGHGAQASAPEEFWPVEPDRMLETLVCHDSRIDEDHWDLADKELAKLIAGVSGTNSQQSPHVAVILDCCHSGSGTRSVGTRRAEPDYRQRPLSSFLVSPEEVASSTSGTRSVTPTAIKLPVGRHVVLSACQDIEEAKEYLGGERPHGAFSYFLQDSLAKANGPLSYRDLFKRTDALVRNNTQVQAPQMEATHSEDLEQLFLGGAIAPAPPYYTVSYHPTHSWVIDGGAIHGLQVPTDAETTELALFPFDSTPEQLEEVSGAIAQVNVTQVLPQLSKIDGSDPALANQSNTFKAVVLSVPLPSVSVFLEGDEAGVSAVRQAITTASPQGGPSLYIKATDNIEGASYRLLAKDNTYSITPPSEERVLVTPEQGYATASAQKVMKNLEHIARWKAIAELDSPANSQIQGAIKLSIFTGEGDSHESATEITDPQIRLEYAPPSPGTQDWTPPKFRIKLHNTSNQTLYCALFYLTETFKVNNIKPDRVGGLVKLQPDEDIWFAGGRALRGEVAEGLWKQGITECRDLLKLIACREEFDPTLMNLGGLGTPIVRPTTRSVGRNGALAKLMQRVNTRDISFADEEPSLDDWVATQIAFTFVRPQPSTPINRSAPIDLGSQVNIAPHPALTAKASLTTVAQSTRDVHGFVMPTLFKQAELDDHTEPFQFTQSRSSDPGLSALELRDVDNVESVTAQTPLIIESAMPLEEDEYVLPIAYDGEFYLPLGYGKSNESGKTQIVLERLTDPVSEGSRSVQGSIRIFFQKVITKKLGERLSKKLGVSFEYPLLAAAQLEHPSTKSSETDSSETDDAEQDVKVVYVREVETVKAQVAQANNIALYIHGIFGDTESMLPSIDTAILAIEDETRPIGQLYDLVLAFDYENLNTTIDQNGRLLKQRLEAIGLGANHGKTLHIIAHSMGGLVSRWFIEQEGGNEVVNHLIMLGTPNAGSPWPQVQAGITAAVSFALNGLSIVAAPLKLLHGLLQRIEKIDLSLDQMQPGSDFLDEIAQSKDPGVPYTLVVGNTSLVKVDKTASLKEKIVNKLWKVAELPFFKQPNDIAVLVESITAIPAGRLPAPKELPTACNHLEYFIHPAGLTSLSTAVVGTGITASTSGMNARATSGKGSGSGESAVKEAAKEEPEGESGLPAVGPLGERSQPVVESQPAVERPVVEGAERMPKKTGRPSRHVIDPWIWGLVAIAVAGLGVFVWSEFVDPPSAPSNFETNV